ncbi:RNA polymerase sigma factor [Microbacterium sp. 2P01SA-2]|uniref:RNA polymerase sigma factor n=1 Tax=unclassified Microbacterium TaxID=2609290 RepID=UPI00399FDA24
MAFDVCRSLLRGVDARSDRHRGTGRRRRLGARARAYERRVRAIDAPRARLLRRPRRAVGGRLARLPHDVFFLSCNVPEEQDHAADVRAAITRLQAVDQEIIRLVYWDGFSLVDVAQHLGMNTATVRSRHARARSLLQTLLHTERV